MQKFILSGLLALSFMCTYLPLMGQTTEESGSGIETSTIVGAVVGGIVAVIVVAYLQKGKKE